jgi:hypothetical protein
LLVVAAVYWVNRTSDYSAVRSQQPATDSILHIPLEQTVLARQEFVRAFGTTDPRHTWALYEQFLPRIGANGIGQAIQVAHPFCHSEAHELGRLIFSKLHDVGTSLESCADACTSGCMHGVLMQFFAASGPTGGSSHQHAAQLTAADVAARIPTFCESATLTRMYLPGDCAHGVGHAVTFLSSYDISAGIDLCERFPSYALRYYCATGAYMEYWTNPRSRSDYPIDDTLHPCEKVRYPAACFRYMMTNPTRWRYAKNARLERTEEQCARLNGKYRLGCFHGIGFAQVLTVAYGGRSVAKVCGFGSREDQTVCLDGAMERLGKFSPTVAAARCATLTDWRREVCQAAASRKMYDTSKSFAMYQR